MKLVDDWWWPDGEAHMIEWIADRKNRMILNNRPSYQGKKQVAALIECPMDRRRTMIDAGAHIGLWSYNFAHWFEKIEAFEPVWAHRDCFVRNLIEEDYAVSADSTITLGEKITLHPFALGDREGMVHIRVNPTSTGDSWVKGKGDIPMRTIDSFALTEVDLIKVDAEGYEEFILKGATETIKQWKPVICVEQKRRMPEKFGLKPQGALVFLTKIGYKLKFEIGGDFIMVPT